MSGTLLELPMVLAQEGAGATWLPYIYLLPIPFLFYFMIIRPQRQQEQKRREMLDALKKNDRVLTSGGIYGTVITVDGNQDRVVLRIDDEKGVKVAFSRASVSRVIDATPEKSSE